MSLRPLLKPLAAVLLASGLLTLSVAPADAVAKKAPAYSSHDTGWGLR